ncbi:hypothetical protein [Shewanella algae]|nr:hypothetical protein [Shewanella algae]BCV29212.1 hypothetical protein TUM3811_30720 [Shewanella algae]
MKNPELVELLNALYLDLGNCNLDNATVRDWHRQKQQQLKQQQDD